MAIRETVRVTSSDELKEIIEKEYEANKTAAIIDLNFIDVSNLTKLRLPLLRKFNGYLDISNWDVSNVVSMNGLFALANFSSDLSKWDVSNIENMNRMFKGLKGTCRMRTGTQASVPGLPCPGHATSITTTNRKAACPKHRLVFSP